MKAIEFSQKFIIIHGEDNNIRTLRYLTKCENKKFKSVYLIAYPQF